MSAAVSTCPSNALLPGEDAHAVRRGSQLPGHAALERCRSAEVGGLEQVTWRAWNGGFTMDEDGGNKTCRQLHPLAMFCGVVFFVFYFLLF